MAIHEILTYPDDRLKAQSETVVCFDQQLNQLIQDLEETMAIGPGAVGIAAPQIGKAVRTIIVDVSSKKKIKHHGHLVLINPEIIAWNSLTTGREGCLSVPDFTGNVVRAEHITLTAQSVNGDLLNFEMEGYEARAVQHEIDHLDGLLFLDRLVSKRNDLFIRKTIKTKEKK